MVSNIVTILAVTHLLYGVYGAPANNEQLIETSEGSIRGTITTTRNKRSVASYLGIPYAEPPVGDLRFHDPIPKKSWNGTLDAVKDGPECAQTQSSSVVGEEDCLYLNVFTPEIDENKRMLPVMVYIHGGAFVTGNGNSTNFGPGYLLDKDVVLVVINYRLTVFGFLSTGDKVAPGNFGLKDQTLALQWIQKNIKAFGGDPKRVTIFGISAGGASVNLHAFSDLSKGLFQQYIAESGSALAPWAVHNISTYSSYATKLGKLYFCPTDTSSNLIACLRTLSVEQLLNTLVFPPLLQIFSLTWGPTIEPDYPNAFLKDYPGNLLRKNELDDVKFISGHVRDEGLIVSAVLYADDFLYLALVANLRLVVYTVISELLPQADPTSVTNDVMDFYFDGVPFLSKNITLSQVTNFVSDLFFFYPEWIFLNHEAQYAKNLFYHYSFDYRGTFSTTSKSTKNNVDLGVAHSDDGIYLSPINPADFGLPNLSVSKTDYEVVDTMVNLWTSFATNGIPIADNLEDPTIWKPYIQNSSYLQIGNNSSPSVTLLHESYNERLEFWKQRLPY